MLCLTYKPGQALPLISFLLCSTHFLPALHFILPTKNQKPEFPRCFQWLKKWSTGLKWFKVAYVDYMKLAFAK